MLLRWVIPSEAQSRSGHAIATRVPAGTFPLEKELRLRFPTLQSGRFGQNASTHEVTPKLGPRTVC